MSLFLYSFLGGIIFLIHLHHCFHGQSSSLLFVDPLYLIVNLGESLIHVIFVRELLNTLENLANVCEVPLFKLVYLLLVKLTIQIFT